MSMSDVLKCAGSIDFKKAGSGCRKYENGMCADAAAVLKAMDSDSQKGFYISFKDYPRCSGCDALKPIREKAQAATIWIEDDGKMHGKL